MNRFQRSDEICNFTPSSTSTSIINDELQIFSAFHIYSSVLFIFLVESEFQFYAYLRKVYLLLWSRFQV